MKSQFNAPELIVAEGNQPEPRSESSSAAFYEYTDTHQISKPKQPNWSSSRPRPFVTTRFSDMVAAIKFSGPKVILSFPPQFVFKLLPSDNTEWILAIFHVT